MLHNNYVYQFERQSIKGINKWRCEKRKGFDCKGCLQTKIVGGYHIKVSVDDHNHYASNQSVIRQKFSNKLKHSAAVSNDPPVKIHQYHFSQLTEDEAFFVPSKEASRQIIKRKRKDDQPAEPASVFLYEVPETFSNFCLHDKSDDEERVIIFGSKESLKTLCQSPLVLMDGTFFIVSRLFSQLYTLHGQVTPQLHSENIFPLLFIFMSSKNANAYRLMFSMITELAEQEALDFKPSIILTDFEQAVIKVVPEVKNYYVILKDPFHI